MADRRLQALEIGSNRFHRAFSRLPVGVALCDETGKSGTVDDVATFFGRLEQDGIAKLRRLLTLWNAWLYRTTVSFILASPKLVRSPGLAPGTGSRRAASGLFHL